MNRDMVWQLLRYALIAAGSYLASRGFLESGEVEGIVAAFGTLFVIGWGLWVRWDTHSVPAKVVEKAATDPTVPTIPIVSPATGAVKEPS